MDITSQAETSSIDTSGQENPAVNDLVQENEQQVAIETQGNDDNSGQGKSGLSEIDKLKFGYEKRISKLTNSKKEYEERLAALESKLNPAEEEINRDDMTDDEYIEYKAKTLAKQELESYVQKQHEEAEYAAQVQAHADDWNSKIKEFGKEDYADKVSAVEEYIPADVKQLIGTSSNGPAIAYELANNPDLIIELNKLDPQRRIFAVLNIENKIKAGPQVTNATPTLSSEGGGNPTSVDPSKMSTKQWMEWRKKQLTKK